MAVYENKVKNLLSLFCNHSGHRNLVMLSVDSQAVKAVTSPVFLYQVKC